MSPESRELQVVFETEDQFQLEYSTNIGKGGTFVPTSESFDLREGVKVHFELTYRATRFALRGEVVHCVPAELASAGATPGVAVQFEARLRDLKGKLEPLLPSAAAVEPAEENERRSGRGRRDSPRNAARVRARVLWADGADFAAYTRNLSRSGVLVSVVDTVIPTGSEILIQLARPGTEAAVETAARVMRHVRGARGEVTALGIRFEPAPEFEAELHRFVEDVTSVEHNRRLGGISGRIEELGLATLLQTFGQSAKQGQVTVTRGGEEGILAFEDRMLCAAQLGAARGPKALARMLSWDEGHFEFHARVDADLVRDAPVPVEAAVLDGMRLVDEHVAAGSVEFPPQATLETRAPLAEDEALDLTKLELAILDLAEVGMTVHRLVDIIPEADAEIYIALASLVEQGFIAVDDDGVADDA